MKLYRSDFPPGTKFLEGGSVDDDDERVFELLGRGPLGSIPVTTNRDYGCGWTPGAGGDAGSGAADHAQDYFDFGMGYGMGAGSGSSSGQGADDNVFNDTDKLMYEPSEMLPLFQPMQPYADILTTTNGAPISPTYTGGLSSYPSLMVTHGATLPGYS